MLNFKLVIPITVRIGDINYGNHVGHQNFFLYFQEARLAYLRQFGFSELDIFGFGMIICAAECSYKQQLFLGDEIMVGCRISDLKSKRFVMDYRIERTDTLCATGSTNNLCYDYQSKRVVSWPLEFAEAIRQYEGGDLIRQIPE